MQAPTARIASRTASGSSWAATTLPTLRQIQSRRRLHQRSELLYDTSKGLQPLFSKEALHLLAVEYQDGLLDRLNKQVKNTASENASVAQTVVNTSKDRSQILAFNLASEALNNTYFLSRLTPDAQRADPSSAPNLKSQLDRNFDGDFKHAWASAAMGMSGSGYLWLVLDQRGRLGILPTFASGTPLVQARQQRGDPDSVSDKETSAEPPQEHSHPQARATGEVFLQEAERRATEMRTKRKQSHILEEINPLLCLSVHERAWMTDYGVWGKEAYLHNFWDVVDWTRLEASFVGLMGVRGQFLK